LTGTLGKGYVLLYTYSDQQLYHGPSEAAMANPTGESVFKEVGRAVRAQRPCVPLLIVGTAR
jgi:hypothetical protein